MFPSPIVHHPFVFDVGPLSLTGFGLAVLLAFLIAQIVSERELARRNRDVEAAGVSDVLFGALVGTLLGGISGFVLGRSLNKKSDAANGNKDRTAGGGKDRPSADRQQPEAAPA